jgi:hypothetical protein
MRSDLIDPILAVHHGRVVKRTGDGAVIEFRSVVDAVRCAIEVQSGLAERNAGLPPEKRIEYRVGIHLGDVVEEMPVKVLADLRRRLDPLARKISPLSVLPPRTTRFGSPLVLSRVHWVEPKLVAEITYLTWTADNLLRHTVYVGLREDKPATEVRREAPRAR